jgi:hypothetical protein
VKSFPSGEEITIVFDVGAQSGKENAL